MSLPLGLVRFTPHFSTADEFKLICLPDELQHTLREGGTLHLVGIEGDELTLCTASETFSVAMVETSNALLLVRPAVTGDEGGAALMAEGLLRGVHELKRAVPGLHRVRDALEEEEWGDAEGGPGVGAASRARRRALLLGSVASSSGHVGGGSGPVLLPSEVAAAAAVQAAEVAAAAASEEADFYGGGGRGAFEEEDAEGEAALLAMQEEEEERGEGESGGGFRGARRAAVGAEGTLPAASTLLMGIDDDGTAPPAPEDGSDALRRAVLGALPIRRGGGRFDAPQCTSALRAPRTSRGWTIEELCNLVQASRAEITTELARLGALIVHPPSARYMLLTPAYTHAVLADVCRAAMAEGWAPNALPLSPLTAALADTHAATIVAHVARLHAEDVDVGAGAGAPAAAGTVALSWSRVAVRIGEKLLGDAREAADAAVAARRSGSGGTPSHALVVEFMAAWTAGVDRLWPSTGSSNASGGGEGGHVLSLDLLRGLLLVDGPSLRFFPEAELPHEPSRRFKALFGMRKAWSEGDLAPFLEPIVLHPHRKLTDLLAQYCRVTNAPGGARTFSERK